MKSVLFTLFVLNFGMSYSNSFAVTINSSGGIATSGDFNEDGYLDLAIVNPGYDTVSVRTGIGNGKFNTPVNYASQTRPYAVATGKFGTHTHLDLAVVNKGSNTVSVYSGNGDGTFNTQVTYSVGTSPSAIALGDFTNDGYLDIAVTNAGGSTVSYLSGTSTGTFNTQVTFAVGSGSNAGCITVGDFNADTYKDIAVVNTNDSTVSVLINSAGGSSVFNTQVTYDVGDRVFTTGGISLGDFNGDNDLDLAVVSSNDNAVNILTGATGGTFNDQISFGVEDGTGHGGITIADLNNDGNFDLTVINPGTDSVSVLIGNGNTTFKSQIAYKTAARPQDVVVGDVNGDGYLDLVTVSNASSTTTLLGRGDGRFYK